MIRLDPVLSFFMSRQEAEEMLAHWVRKHALHCVLSRSLPFGLQTFTPDSETDLSQFDKAWLDTSPFPGQARNGGDLAMANRECLHFRLSIESKDGLVAGSLGSFAQSGSRGELWTSLAQEVIDATTGGMWIHNTSSGKLFFSKKYRYSQRAAILHAQGMPLRESSGSDVFFPERPFMTRQPG